MADPITQAAAAFANWAYATFFAAAGYGTTAHAVISATLFYGAQAVLYTGVSMGLNAVAQAQIPSPEGQKLTKKQPRPPRQYCGGGPVRMSGPYMLRETISSHMAIVIALSDWRLASVGRVWLNDDVTVRDALGWVQEGEGGRYGTGDLVRVAYRMGHPVETPYSIFPATFEAVWPTTGVDTARGDGVASMAVYCQHRSRESFATHFPNGEVIPSAEIQAVCFDWRDPTQQRDNPASWKASTNPVVWMVFIEWMQNNRNWTRSIEPVLTDLTAEADYCDEMIPRKGGMQKRYTWAGGWTAETEPDAVRQNLLQAFDGWLTTDGKGRLVIKAGRYVEPTFVIPAEKIQAFTWRRGQTDEESCNVLVVSFTSPDHDYTVVECDPWVDADDIALRGVERSEPLNLLWVDNHPQARRLAKRKMKRVNARRRGTVTTDIWGLDGLGHRYIRVQNTALKSMADVVLEVMNVDIDVNRSRVTFDVILADPTMDEWDPATEEGAPVPVADRPAFEDFVEQPTEFSGAFVDGDVRLTWRNPFDGVFDFVNVYRSADSNFSNASIIGFFGGATGQLVTFDDTSPPATPSYWLVSVDMFGRESSPLGPVSPQPPAKTYEEFVAHITSLAVDGVISWGGNFSASFGPPRSYVVDATLDEVGTMSGSPWGPSASSGRIGVTATAARVMQHGLPTKDAWDAQRLGGYRMFYRVSSVSENAAAASVERNGYTSNVLFSGNPFRFLEEIIYWDEGAMRMRPRLGLGPEPYDW